MIDWREEQAAVYDKMILKSKSGFTYVFTPETIEFFNTLIPKSGKILDLGCGGDYVKHLSDREWYGVDISTQTIDKVRKFYKMAIVADVTRKIPFPDNFFDCVFASAIFHHVYQEIPAAVKEIRRVLKPNGELILIDHDSADTHTRLMHGSALRLVPCKCERALDIGKVEQILKDNGFSFNGAKHVKVYADQQALKMPLAERMAKVPLLIIASKIGKKTSGDFLINAKNIKENRSD
jgi:ubiquinone/menaquinone biosynthesis C-methylase UbiE